jgi:hypothetical protein
VYYLYFPDRVEQRGWSPDTWTVVEGTLVVGEEGEAEVDAMEEREEVLDEAEAWVRAYPMQEPPTGEE